MTGDWILRIGDGQNFINSSRHQIWGIQSSSTAGKHFVKNVKPGDRLWFVINKTKNKQDEKTKQDGKLFCVATYQSHRRRILGPLFAETLTDEELGWKGDDLSKYDMEVHYTDMYGLNACNMLTHIRGVISIRKYNPKTCALNLPVEYDYINRYSKVVGGGIM
jgi:hypothetical protein